MDRKGIWYQKLYHKRNNNLHKNSRRRNLEQKIERDKIVEDECNKLAKILFGENAFIDITISGEYSFG